MPQVEVDYDEEANKDPEPSPYRCTVLYGDHGKRKTSTAAAMVRERGLLLSSDGSWKTLLNPRHAEIYKKIKIIELTGLSQFDHIDFSGYDTIIWDTVSETVDQYLDLLYDEAKWKGNFRDKPTTSNKELKDVEVLAPMDYRVTRDIFRPTFRKLFVKPAHLIFTAHWNDPMKGLSADTTRRPGIPNATFKPIARHSDLIVCIRPEAGKFVADMTTDSIAYLGKSRIQGLEGKMPLDTFISKYKEYVF